MHQPSAVIVVHSTIECLFYCFSSCLIIIAIIIHSFIFLKVIMSGQFFRFISILHLLNLVCTTNSRPFVPNDSNTSSLGTQQFSPRSLETTLSIDKTNRGEVGFEEAEYSEVSRIGSSPPSCEHKCYGCMPCEAIQVPTTTSHVGVQYANYEPEGWKCKCGPTFYTP